MSKRINIATVQGKAIQAMMGLETYLAGTTLTAGMKELIKVRASMINKCAYCIQMHTTQALEQGEDQQRLFALAAWQESPLFTDIERAVLALTDEITLISVEGVTDEVYQNALSCLGEKGIAEVIMQAVTINAWNRIALSLKMVH
ncbi:alkyl hydroperoxide reductase AhpD [Shewanella sp. NFH-SH190041]|uniref:carboxymuconolactone decarboxylase family protein n=1 Tax=Shewanella sp. NFH-SH190041 TaxID=2950245 RepID=UPI0021C2BF59|nr:carboxymuconolactone decarboxylase family protein [Shewanella sp. NFH-SH190041]BDM63531.1 alkyl hydroperoxide reductase AhpD [Shewanella sp. NFH-SH190041]